MKFKIKLIAGDASFRKYYRILNKKDKKIIVVSKKEKYKNLLVYSAINDYLRKNKILTPITFSKNFSKGILYVEDFGDLTYHKVLLKKKNKLPEYKKIVDLLIKIQKIKPKKKIRLLKNKNFYFKRYSEKYLNKESNLFFDWYLPLVLEKKIFFTLRKKLKKILSNLYKKIYFSNKFFVHRDFHVSNLMKVKKNIGVIDTQDAIIGNPAYDLVSLVDDVRIKTNTKLKNKIIKYYLNIASKKYSLDREKFMNDFNILSIQRNLKIIGIFSRLYKRDKKEKYLKLIPYAWKLLELRLKSKNFKEIKLILDKMISKNIRKKKLYEIK